VKATIERSGGVGGFQVAGTVDTSELGGDLAARAAAALEPQRLAAAAGQPGEPGAADPHVYEVTLETGESYAVTASAATSDLVAVLDELVNEVIRRQRGG